MPSAAWSRVRALLGTARFWIFSLATLLVVLVLYYALSNRYTPFTSDAYVQAFVVQVAPQVAGQVTAVHVKENQRVEKGDLLFEIDPRPFAHKVRQLEASQTWNRQQVAQMKSELTAAQAEESKIMAELAYAEAVFKQEQAIFKKEATTERRFLDAQQKHLGLIASREKAKAVIRQKEDALSAMLGGEHAIVAEAIAQLATASLDLEWTKVYAPVAGYVTNMQLQPGSYVQPGKAVLTCIDAETWWIVANFRETSLEHIRPDQPASIAFKSYPGRVIAAKVQSVGWGVHQGQGVPSGNLPGVTNPQEWLPPAQRFQVRLVLANRDEIPLRVGATGSVTVFTTTDSPLNPIADAWQQVAAWVNYLR